jgi:hypothetical protein
MKMELQGLVVRPLENTVSERKPQGLNPGLFIAATKGLLHPVMVFI